MIRYTNPHLLYFVLLPFVLYCTVLYFTVLYCTVLYFTLLYFTVLYCTVLYCVLYFTLLYCTLLYFTVLYCTVLYCTVYCTLLYFTYRCVTRSRSRRSWSPTWRRRSKTRRTRWKLLKRGFILANTDPTSSCVATLRSTGKSVYRVTGLFTQNWISQ